MPEGTVGGRNGPLLCLVLDQSALRGMTIGQMDTLDQHDQIGYHMEGWLSYTLCGIHLCCASSDSTEVNKQLSHSEC